MHIHACVSKNNQINRNVENDADTLENFLGVVLGIDGTIPKLDHHCKPGCCAASRFEKWIGRCCLDDKILSRLGCLAGP